MPKHKPTIGSISHGTMRTVDLLGAFASELEWLSPVEHVELIREALQRTEELDDGRAETEEDSDCLGALFDALDSLAPPYCYFGAHEGDGSDYGFWPSMEAIEDLPRIENVEGEDRPAEDHAYVNDHGNVTVYNAAGDIILELV